MVVDQSEAPRQTTASESQRLAGNHPAPHGSQTGESAHPYHRLNGKLSMLSSISCELTSKDKYKEVIKERPL